jgi:tRNA(Ile)-lysidine synthase
MKKSIELRFLDTVRREDLLPSGARVTAAVSGGADSVGLLLLLDRFRKHMRWDLSVLHIDHGYRASSFRDAEFVRETAASAGVPFELRRLPARTRGGSPEGEFSAARQRIFEEVADGGLVAVGHTATDRAETLLLRLLEGAGLRGLGGMDYRGIGPVRRPLLDLSGDEVRGYVSSRGAGWVEDETNLDPSFARNRIRAAVIPVLEDLFPGAVKRLAASSAGLAGWRRVADGLTAVALELAGMPGEGTVLRRSAYRSLEGVLRLAVLWEICGRPRTGLGELEKTDRWICSGCEGVKLLPGGIRAVASLEAVAFEPGRRDGGA